MTLTPSLVVDDGAKFTLNIRKKSEMTRTGLNPAGSCLGLLDVSSASLKPLMYVYPPRFRWLSSSSLNLFRAAQPHSIGRLFWYRIALSVLGYDGGGIPGQLVQ